MCRFSVRTKGENKMKTMQDFHTRMISLTPDAPAIERRLKALTGFSKARLEEAASESVWYWWEAPQSAAATQA
jgi:hypothetical protein